MHLAGWLALLCLPLLVGCQDDSAVAGLPTLEARINDAAPLDAIVVIHDEAGNYQFTRYVADEDYDRADADDGSLLLYAADGSLVRSFNLFTTREVILEPDATEDLRLIY